MFCLKVCPLQHWISGEHDKQGQLVNPFIAGNGNKRIIIRVTPMLRHDVNFIIPATQQELGRAELFQTPQELQLNIGEKLFMSSCNLYSNGNAKNNVKNQKSSSISIINRTLSRKHLIPYHQGTTIKNIKETLEALSEIPFHSQKLIFNQRILQDDELISSLDSKNICLEWDINYNSLDNGTENFTLSSEINDDCSQFVTEDEYGLCNWDFQRSCELNLYISK